MTTEENPCIKLKRAGLAIDPQICICVDDISADPECLIHVGLPVDCGHYGCIQCRDVQCCQLVNRGRRAEQLDDSPHLDRAHMRGKHGHWCADQHGES